MYPFFVNNLITWIRLFNIVQTSLIDKVTFGVNIEIKSINIIYFYYHIIFLFVKWVYYRDILLINSTSYNYYPQMIYV